MMLCDHAAVAEGKLYVSGGGWSLMGPAPSPSAIALLIDVPWDQTNHKVVFNLSLHGADGDPVMQPGPMGEEMSIQVGGEFEVGRPPGLAPGTPIGVPLAINIPPLLLAPGQRFSWDLKIDGTSQDDWHLAFSTRGIPVPASSPTNLPPPG
jgi:hypothetical protein